MPRLREIIREKGISQSQLAKEAKLSTWTVNYACKGQMSDQTRETLASVLKKIPKDLGPVTLQPRNAQGMKRPKPKQPDPIQSAQVKAALIHDAVEEQIAPPISVPKTTINDLVSIEVTETESEALVAALFRTRKSKGFDELEVAALEGWAEKIKHESHLLQEVLAGRMQVDVENGKVTFKLSKSPIPLSLVEKPKTQPVRPRGAEILAVISAYLSAAKSDGRADSYINKQRFILNKWVEILNLKSISDMTIDDFKGVIRTMFIEKKAMATVNNHAKTIIAFYAWAAEKSFLPADILAGMGSLEILRGLKRRHDQALHAPFVARGI